MYWTKVLDEKWYFARGFLPRSRLYFRGSESEPSVGGRGCTCLIPTTIPNCSASASYLLAQEARNAHLASMVRAARRNRTIGQERTTWSPGRAIALWRRTSVPYFRA